MKEDELSPDLRRIIEGARKLTLEVPTEDEVGATASRPKVAPSARGTEVRAEREPVPVEAEGRAAIPTNSELRRGSQPRLGNSESRSVKPGPSGQSRRTEQGGRTSRERTPPVVERQSHPDRTDARNEGDRRRPMAEPGRSERPAPRPDSQSRGESPPQMFVENRAQLEEEFLKMKEELAYLKKVHPIRLLLEAKQAEVEKLKRSLQRFPVNHPERRIFEGLLKDHIVERDRIRALADRLDRQFFEVTHRMRSLRARLSTQKK